MFQKMFLKWLISPLQYIKQSSKVLKNVVFFPILHFGWHANGGAIAPPPAPPGYASGYTFQLAGKNWIEGDQAP